MKRTYDIKKFQESDVFKLLMYVTNYENVFFQYFLGKNKETMNELLIIPEDNYIRIGMKDGLVTEVTNYYHNGETRALKYNYVKNNSGEITRVHLNYNNKVNSDDVILVIFTHDGVDIVHEGGRVYRGIIEEDMSIEFENFWISPSSTFPGVLNYGEPDSTIHSFSDTGFEIERRGEVIVNLTIKEDSGRDGYHSYITTTKEGSTETKSIIKVVPESVFS